MARRVLCWRRYTLNQIHFHSGSETTLGGRRYDMEAHLVHYEGGAAAKGAALVVGVFLTVVDDAAAADVRADSLASLPADAYAGFVAPHVARGATFFAYAGSMTTPPCASGVQWVSFKRPLTITRRFLARFSDDVGPARVPELETAPCRWEGPWRAPPAPRCHPAAPRGGRGADPDSEHGVSLVAAGATP